MTNLFPRAPANKLDAWDLTSIEGMSSLEVFTFYGDHLRVKRLLQNGVGDPNQVTKTRFESTILIHACDLSWPEVVRVLLEGGADPNLCGSDFASAPPLGTLANRTGDPGEDLYQEHIECAELLLQYGANINGKNYLGRTPLMFASDLGTYQLVQWLVEKGADVNCVDENGWTALDWSYWAVADGGEDPDDESSASEELIQIRRVLRAAGGECQVYKRGNPKCFE